MFDSNIFNNGNLTLHVKSNWKTKAYEQCNKPRANNKTYRNEMRNGLNYAHLVHVFEECQVCEGMPSLLGFTLPSLIHIHRENILELLQRYDTNGLDPKGFMDEVGSNMV